VDAAINGLHLREAAIHEQFRSRDVAAVVGCQKHHELSDLIGMPNLPNGTMPLMHRSKSDHAVKSDPAGLVFKKKWTVPSAAES